MGERGERRTKSRILRRTGIAVAVLAGVFVLAVTIIVAFGITLSLEALRPNIEAAAQSALGRKVRIEGPLTLRPGLRPTIEIRSLRIANVPTSDAAVFAQIGRVRVSVQLLPLIRREIHLDEITIDNVDVRLETGADGEGNWVFAPEKPTAATDSADGSAFEFVRLSALSIRDLAIDYYGKGEKGEKGSGWRIAIAVESVEGSAGRDDPTELSAKGVARGQPFSVSVAGGSLAGLSDPGRPWPVDIQARLADAVATLRGGIVDPLGARSVDVGIALRAEKLDALEELLVTTLPPMGAFDLKARLEASAAGARLSDMEGAIGRTMFRGDVAVDLLSSPPRLSGSVDIAILDLEPFLTDDLPPPESPTEVSLDDAFPWLQGLHDIDAEIMLTVDRVLGLPMDIRDASVSPVIDGGRLAAQISATISEVPVEGMLAIESAPDALGFDIALASEGSDIENLRTARKHAESVKGSFERFTLRASGRGHNLRTALEDLDVRVLLDRADLSYGHRDREEPIPLILEAFELALPRGQALRLSTTGTLFDRNFTVEVGGATVAEALSGGAWPMSLSATGVGARLSVEGSVADLGDLSGTALDLDFAGENIGDLAAWVGTRPDASAAYRLRGRLRFEDDKVFFESARVNLGETAMTGALSMGRRDHDLPLDVRVHFSRIATTELATMFPSRETSPAGAERPGLNLTMPVLPYEVTIADADIDIRADRILLHPIDVTDAAFKGRIRGGHLQNSPFAATVGNVPFSGGVSLDLRGRVPVATFEVGAENVDVGSLLRDLQITESSETKARRLHAKMVLRGSKLKTIIERSEISVVLEDGVTIIRDPNTQAPLEIRVVESTLTSTPGEPVVYDLQGLIESTPITIRVETSPLASLLESHDRVPIRLVSEVAGLNVELNASLARPFKLRNLRFDLSARGRSLDSLDELLHVSVPPWGPYSVDGTIQLDRIGYHAPRLEVRVGSSRLSGDVSLDTTGNRPRLIVNLNGKTLQLNDFEAGDWSAFDYRDTDAASVDELSRSASLRDRKTTVKALATPESLRSMDARVSLVVNEVLSGSDRLGSGRLVASLDKGRFTLDPVSIEIPEGSADGRFSFEMTQDTVTTRTKVQIDHLDYGVLARRIDTGADAAGWLSLNLDLRSHSDTLEDMMASASGQFDFAVWPTSMQADIFDLWAANLLLAILPSLDSESGSRVNCIVGVFDVTDGVMRQKRLLIDTTNVQVAGEGEVDFQNGEVDFMLIPDAKRPRMFVLGTPIRVSGDYRDLESSTDAGEWARTAARFVTSIFAPIRRLFTTPIPADGEAACLAAMERSAE